MIIQLDINFRDLKLTHKHMRRGTRGGFISRFSPEMTQDAVVYKVVHSGDLKTLRLVVAVYLSAHESRRGKSNSE